MANQTQNSPSPRKPNVSASGAKGFQSRRLYLQLLTLFAVALAVCLGISIFFRVDTITVTGAERYNAWTVAQASGIENGDNLLFFGRAGAQVKIRQALPYVEKVRIGIRLPGTVLIEIEEVPVVYSIRDLDGSWWLITSQGRVVEQVNSASAVNCTSIEGVTLDNPVQGEQAVAWEQPQQTDPSGQSVITAQRSADLLQAALEIAQQLERFELMGEAASIHVEDLQQLYLWYGSRFQVMLGDSSEMDSKIAAMKSAVEQMGQFQSGILEVLLNEGKWKVVYRQQ